MKQKVDIKQKITVTQSLQQYLGLLQMSNADLEQKVKEEMERNPLIEVKESDSVSNFQQQSYNKLGATSLDNEIYEGIEDKGVAIEEFLRRQLFLKFEDNTSRKIGSEIIFSINDAGYLSKSVNEISKKVGESKEAVEKVLLEMQKFDPPGVFARDLAECIEIQLKDMDLMYEDTKCILDHIELLGKGKHNELSKVCGLTEERFSEILSHIRKTSPKPLAGFEASKKSIDTNIKPDVILFKDDYGEWIIELADDFSKRLKINDQYKLVIKNAKTYDKDNEQLSEKLKDAQFLIKGIQKRNETILRVSYEILNVQHNFFDKGDDIELKKLTLNDIADKLDLHISTISRAVNNKYMLTPFGIFELKYFFSKGLKNNSDSGAVVTSRKKLLKIIKNLIHTEKEAKMVMSDDKLREVLEGMGFNVSRRTIAKYREEMNIPSSNIRKSLLK